MSTFVVVVQPTGNIDALREAVKKAYEGSHTELDGGHGWLVSARATAQEVSNRLGISDGSTSSAIVFEFTGYFGRANPNLWSWIATYGGNTGATTGVTSGSSMGGGNVAGTPAAGR